MLPGYRLCCVLLCRSVTEEQQKRWSVRVHAARERGRDHSQGTHLSAAFAGAFVPWTAARGGPLLVGSGTDDGLQK